MIRTAFALAALLQASSSLIIDKPDSIVNGWTEIRKTSAQQPIKLVFALKNQNTDQLHDTLLAVSTPGNPEYGNHKSVEEIRSMIAPSFEAIDAVQDWLLSHFEPHQIRRETENDDLWSVTTDIQTAEKVLKCKYYDYKSDIDGETMVSRVKLGSHYHVDEAVAQHLYFVSPTHRFPYLQPRLKSSVGRGEVNPTFLRSLYNVGSAKYASRNNSQAVASFRTQYYEITDCRALWAKYNIIPSNVTNVPQDSPAGYGIEAELDTQYMSSMGQGIPMQVWWTKGFNFEDALISFTENVLNAKSTASPLFSVSYGGPETDFGASYITKLNTQLAAMGTAGITVMFASGDSGAGGGCKEGTAFMPDYPASSPYVTAVGGVTGGTPGRTPVGESVWVDGGGGFSTYSGRQSWQSAAVSHYLATSSNLPDKSLFNESGRGYPDIAAQSVDFEIFVKGKPEAVSGTSCASPTAGGIFALLNDVRALQGQSKLGFLNPFIYQTAATNPTAFNDCTTGYNKGCTPGVARGFSAQAQWDAASGYGSPNYGVLKAKVLEAGRHTVKHQKAKLTKQPFKPKPERLLLAKRFVEKVEQKLKAAEKRLLSHILKH